MCYFLPMHAGYRIRRGHIDDAAGLAKLAAETFEATYPDLTKKEAEHYAQKEFSTSGLRVELADAGIFLLTDASGGLAGYAHLKVTDAPYEVRASNPIELVRLFLERRAQGHGLSRLLLSNGLRWSADFGHDACWLKVWDQNPQARRFYEKLGFEVIGEALYQIGGMNDRVLLMVKSI